MDAARRRDRPVLVEGPPEPRGGGNRRSARSRARCRRRRAPPPPPAPGRRGSTQVTLPTPPRFRNATGASAPIHRAQAKWKKGTSGAPSPPLATSAVRKSQTTGTPASRASRSPRPIWWVPRPRGSCASVWPWKPMTSTPSNRRRRRACAARTRASTASSPGSPGHVPSASRRSARSPVGRGRRRSARSPDRLAVGFEDRRVHPVHGGPRHQPQRAHRPPFRPARNRYRTAPPRPKGCPR